VPESLFNGDVVICNAVCDKCQRYFGTKVEAFVLQKTIFAWARYLLRSRNKKGKPFSIDTTLPNEPAGKLPASSFTQSVVRMAEGKIHAVETPDNPGGDTIRMVNTPRALRLMGQFCLKVAIEMIALDSHEFVRGPFLDRARSFARYGRSDEQNWPLFMKCSVGKPSLALHFEPSPIMDGQLWCEFDVALFKVRFDLLTDTDHPPPEGFTRLRSSPIEDRESLIQV
jgi:hypothetical protein